jgi:hypothetical protein
MNLIKQLRQFDSNFDEKVKLEDFKCRRSRRECDLMALEEHLKAKCELQILEIRKEFEIKFYHAENELARLTRIMSN